MIRTVSISGKETIDWQTLERVKNRLTRFVEADSSAPITLYLDSPGGDKEAMKEIIFLIQACPAPIRAVVLGEASSAAFVILQFCARRIALKKSSVLFHRPRISAAHASAITGFPAEEDHIIPPDPVHEEIVEHIAGRSGLPPYIVNAMAETELVLSAPEALQLRLIDDII